MRATDKYLGLIERARSFAISRHGDQKYGQAPFALHLGAVARIAKDSGLSDTIIAAAWLHDILEDTSTKQSELRDEFGLDVEILVTAVTDPPGLPNRKARFDALISRLANTVDPVEDALALKLCDRIANVEDAKQRDLHLFEMYEKELPEFFRLCHRPSIKVYYLWTQLLRLFCCDRYS